jgi:hypothetical protein
MLWDECAACLQHAYFRALDIEPAHTIDLTIAAPSKLFPSVIDDNLVKMLDDTKEQRQMFRGQRIWRAIWYPAELLSSLRD